MPRPASPRWVQPPMTMKTQGAIPTRRLRALQNRPLRAQPATPATQLPFLEAAPAQAAHDLLVLNPRDDLAIQPEFEARLGAYFEVMLS